MQVTLTEDKKRVILHGETYQPFVVANELSDTKPKLLMVRHDNGTESHTSELSAMLKVFGCDIKQATNIASNATLLNLTWS